MLFCQFRKKVIKMRELCTTFWAYLPEISRITKDTGIANSILLDEFLLSATLRYLKESSVDQNSFMISPSPVKARGNTQKTLEEIRLRIGVVLSFKRRRSNLNIFSDPS